MDKKKFSYEFQDSSPRLIKYEVEETEQFSASIEGGVPFVYANRQGMLTPAKILIRMSLGEYKEGFHVHLRTNFSVDAGKPDALIIVLRDQ